MEVLNFTWEALSDPIPLSIFAMIIMQLVGKQIIELLREGVIRLAGLFTKKPQADIAVEWTQRGFVINLATIGICLVVSLAHVGPELTDKQAIVNSVIAGILASGDYEWIKNVFGAARETVRTAGFKWW